MVSHKVLGGTSWWSQFSVNTIGSIGASELLSDLKKKKKKKKKKIAREIIAMAILSRPLIQVR